MILIDHEVLDMNIVCPCCSKAALNSIDSAIDIEGERSGLLLHNYSDSNNCIGVLTFLCDHCGANLFIHMTKEKSGIKLYIGAASKFYMDIAEQRQERIREIENESEEWS